MPESEPLLIVRTVRHDGISRALRPFARVEPQEVVSALVLAVSVRFFAALNLGLIVCWLLVLIALGREHRRRSGRVTTIPPGEPEPRPLHTGPEPSWR